MGLLFFLKPFFFFFFCTMTCRLRGSCVYVCAYVPLPLDGFDLPATAATGTSLGSHGSPRERGRCRGPSLLYPSPATPRPQHPFVLCFTIHPFTSFSPALPLSLSQSHLALLIFHLSGFPIPDSALASLCSTPIKHTQHRWNKVPEPL